jgi:hypothetical protein
MTTGIVREYSEGKVVRKVVTKGQRKVGFIHREREEKRDKEMESE